MQAEALSCRPCVWRTDLWYLICGRRQEKARKSAYGIRNCDGGCTTILLLLCSALVPTHHSRALSVML